MTMTKMETTGALKFSIPSPLAGCPGNIHDDEEEDDEECSASGQQAKKRRLSVQQVRSLEKTFEVENKLEPERKLQLAQELGLHPRQVAVWFQNRRARWKTKQLERDYGQLKLNYECLKSNFEAIKQDNQKLASELNYVKEKWEETQKLPSHNNDFSPAKEGKIISGMGEDNTIPDIKSLDRATVCKQDGNAEIKVKSLAMILNEKIEGSESESSAIVNEQADNNNNNSSHSIDSHISNCYYATGPPMASASDEGLMEAFFPRALIRPKEEQHYDQHHQDFRADANFVQEDPACNFFNVDDATVTVPWWEWP